MPSSFHIKLALPTLPVAILFLFVNFSVARQLTWEHPHLLQTIGTGGAGCDFLFVFKNNSKQNITITEAKTSCGCSEAEITNASAKPGESGVLKVHFDRKKAVGEKHLTILVKTDANDQITTLNATIRMPQFLQVRPQFMQWKVGESPASKEAELLLSQEAAAYPVKASVTNDFNIRLEPTNDKTRYKIYASPKSTATATKGTITLQNSINDPSGTTTFDLLVKP
jgi:hypothetical protein